MPRRRVVPAADSSKAGRDTTRTRTMGKEGSGSPGDLRDRFRGAYKPGAMKPIPSPLDSVVARVKRMLPQPRPRKGK